MASWQDIRELEEKIYCVVEDYLKYPEGYIKPVLKVYLEDVEYTAELEDNLEGTEDDGIYLISDLIREEEGVLEPDVDKISDVANSWLFLD